MHASSEIGFPVPRVDLVVLAVFGDALHVLMRRRTDPPFANLRALPGGIVEMTQDNSLEDCVQRVARRWFKKRLPNFSQALTVGNASRDQRREWSLTVVYHSLVYSDFLTSEQMLEHRLEWLPVVAATNKSSFALDHAELIEHALLISSHKYERAVEVLNFPEGWIPEEFTLVQLHEMCQALSSKRLDMLTFRRRLDAAGLVEPIAGKYHAGGAYRPAQIYKLKSHQQS